jgi:tetratricopeptide (TPR) repeat protein
VALVVLAALSLPAWFASLWRETNSDAASRRAASAYEKKQYAAAEESYGRARQLAPSSRGAFNLGTSQIAAGHREQGSTTLAEAIRDPALRADALYNRGNSALAAKSYDHAVRDYIDALRADPNHAAAKRNLEIALSRRQSARRSGSGGGQDQKDKSKPPQPSPKEGQKAKEGQPDLEALLRSVQQQEQEELRRMRGKAAEGRVGW